MLRPGLGTDPVRAEASRAVPACQGPNDSHQEEHPSHVTYRGEGPVGVTVEELDPFRDLVVDLEDSGDR